MTSKALLTNGIALRAYLILSRFTAPLMRWQLKRRLQQGKENPERYLEKHGIASQPRPASPVIWMHGVGLGEVLALRGLILALIKNRSDLTILVTSSTRTSADVFCKHITPQTIHQFLPLDSKSFVDSFLNHWKPALSVWAEQDLWPALVTETHRRNIPLMLINARMNERAYQSRHRLKSLYRDLYLKFRTIYAQDEKTAGFMTRLGATVQVDTPLKFATRPLEDNTIQRTTFCNALNKRWCWLLASSHLEDEQLAIAAHKDLLQKKPDSLLIIAPRVIDRNQQIIDQCEAHGLTATSRSTHTAPAAAHNVYVADTFGEMGLWYRIANAAFIGGSMGSVQGHNPWEAAVLNCPVIHGPNTDNFSSDYAALHRGGGAILVEHKDQLIKHLLMPHSLQLARDSASKITHANRHALTSLAQQLLDKLPVTQQSI